jgi:hypothetical protein
VPHGKRTKSAIFANFFMGSKNDKIVYHIDGGEWMPMEYVEEQDPSYIELVMEWELAEILMPGKRSSDPAACTHLWRGKILSDLPVGQHNVEIEATDMFGKKHTATGSYRIEQPK